MSTREQELREELAQLEAYAVSKHKAGDRHAAIQDTYSDMREIEARLDERERTLEEVCESGRYVPATAKPPVAGLAIHTITSNGADRIASEFSMHSFTSEDAEAVAVVDGLMDKIR